ncbi:MAG TPA: ABC transporter ATP-binding protein [Pirellulales bacterium]|jgi:putative ABC transport system ATP-binding protein
MNSIIEGIGLTKIYEGGVRVSALRDVDVQILPGTFVAIMGPSGSGKSTLLNLLGALDVPTAGRLLLEGVDVAKLSDDDRTMLRRRRIGFVFQQFNLLPILSAAENVAVPLRLEGKRGAEIDRPVAEVLERVGLSERRDHLPSQLSGGEQQRVAIARALVTRPAMILADEPTGNLDSANGERVIEILRRLVDEEHQTVVMVTHDSAVAQRADRVIVVRDGQICDDYAPRPVDSISAAAHSALAAAAAEPRR